MLRDRSTQMFALACAALIVATPRPARAEDGNSVALSSSRLADCPPLTPHDPWYGWQIWLADAGAVAAAAPLTRVDGLFGRAVFFGAFAIEGPIVHLAHRRLGTAALSLFVRAWVPMLFASTVDQYSGKTLKQLPLAVAEDFVVGPADSFYVGGRMLSGAESFDGAREVAAILGLLTATAIDGLALAYDTPVKTTPAAAPAAERSRALGWTPMPLAVPSVRPGGSPAVGMGVGGTF